VSLTLAEYAQAKQLPLELLQELGVRDADWFGSPALAIAYRDQDGHDITDRYRLALNGSDPFRWPTGTKARGLVYGLEGRKRAAATGWALVVEGESDVQTARLHGVPAFGIPGALMFDDELTSPCLEGVGRLLVVQEPGEAGERFVAALRESRLADRLSIVSLGEHKDVSALHLALDGDHQRFVAAIREADNPLLSGVTRSRKSPESAPPERTQPTQGERLRLTRIADVTAKRVEWVEDNLVARGMLTALVAPGGTVKGLYGIHLAAKLAARGKRTLFVCSEDALDYIVRPRFQAAGCDAELAFALSIEGAHGERTPHFPSDMPLLAQAVDEIEPLLAILDPVASYIDPGLDMGKNNEMRLILQPLITLAHDAYIAILVVYHLGKTRERGAIGTVAFEDSCRQVLTAARDDDDDDVRHLELTKSNIGPTGYGRKLRIVGVPQEIDGEVVEVAKLVDEGRSYKRVHTLLARKEPPGPEPEKRKLARDVLVELLIAAGTSGVNADETKQAVAERADVSASTVWRAFTELKGEGLAIAVSTRDEFGSISEWRWVAKLALLVGSKGA
jgi:hypothetical protein